MATPRLGLVVEDKPTELSCTVVSRKRTYPRMSAHPPGLPQVPNFYLKEHPPSVSIAQMGYSLLSDKPADVVRLTSTHYKVQITQLSSSYTIMRCLAQDVTTIRSASA